MTLAMVETVNSGTVVAMLTIVPPITILGIPNTLAIIAEVFFS